MKATVSIWLIAALATLTGCEIGVRAKVDSRPSEETKQVQIASTIHGTTEEGCQYEIAPDGIITVTAGKCPLTDDKKSMFTDETSSGCEFAISQQGKNLVLGSCNHRHPSTIGDVTTDLTHGKDGCDYALARNGQVTKVVGSCPKDK